MIAVHPHIVSISTEKGRKTDIAYEDIWIKPLNTLAEELSQGYMEYFIATRDVEIHVDINEPMVYNDDGRNQDEETDSAALMCRTAGLPEMHDRNERDKPTRKERDIDNIFERVLAMNNVDGASLTSDKQPPLQIIKSRIGQRQGTASELELAPQRLLDAALQEEL